ncbi:hypothetical protein SCHPADRAFT_1000452 [Schizopora paradoxa]|uniref:Uncharacterized protein n=1 Tax=Schizopora paradoxa TaxID=27342 RepID=A0A0H2RC95_9AGAM|nr:hypothetical protein SCHPADRAFT_1000452 [Schizopora paradoxa]
MERISTDHFYGKTSSFDLNAERQIATSTPRPGSARPFAQTGVVAQQSPRSPLYASNDAFRHPGGLWQGHYPSYQEGFIYGQGVTAQNNAESLIHQRHEVHAPPTVRTPLGDARGGLNVQYTTLHPSSPYQLAPSQTSQTTHSSTRPVYTLAPPQTLRQDTSLAAAACKQDTPPAAVACEQENPTDGELQEPGKISKSDLFYFTQNVNSLKVISCPRKEKAVKWELIRERMASRGVKRTVGTFQTMLKDLYKYHTKGNPSKWMKEVMMKDSTQAQFGAELDKIQHDKDSVKNKSEEAKEKELKKAEQDAVGGSAIRDASVRTMVTRKKLEEDHEENSGRNSAAVEEDTSAHQLVSKVEVPTAGQLLASVKQERSLSPTLTFDNNGVIDLTEINNSSSPDTGNSSFQSGGAADDEQSTSDDNKENKPLVHGTPVAPLSASHNKKLSRKRKAEAIEIEDDSDDDEADNSERRKKARKQRRVKARESQAEFDWKGMFEKESEQMADFQEVVTGLIREGNGFARDAIELQREAQRDSAAYQDRFLNLFEKMINSN